MVGVVAAPLAIDSQRTRNLDCEAHHRDGKRFDVRAEEKLSLAKALQKERQPCHGAVALRLPTGYSA
ncbi:MAG: hypothetical protein DME93_13760 [Verrucomicrobia bacterium]|nr:MAG: hypothetical protein DME93_13760 [Verrucomicrobiota bacterium]